MMMPNNENFNLEQDKDELTLLRQMGIRPSSLAAIEQSRRPWWRKMSIFTRSMTLIALVSSCALVVVSWFYFFPAEPPAPENGAVISSAATAMAFQTQQASLPNTPVLTLPPPTATPATVDATATSQALAVLISIAISGTETAKLLTQTPPESPTPEPTRASPTPTSPPPTTVPTPTPTSTAPLLTMRVESGPTAEVKPSDVITFALAVTKTIEMATGASLKCNPGNLGTIIATEPLPTQATDTELTYSLDGLVPDVSATYTMTVKVSLPEGDSRNPTCYIERDGQQQPAIANFQITRRRLPQLTAKFVPVDIAVDDKVEVSFTLATVDSSQQLSVPIAITVTSGVTNLANLTGTEASRVITTGVSDSVLLTANAVGTGELVVTTLEDSQRFIQTVTVRPIARVKADNANLRSTPNPNSKTNIVGAVKAKDKYPILGRNQDATWWYVRLPAGGGAWISQLTLVETNADDTKNVPIVDDNGNPPASSTSANVSISQAEEFTLAQPDTYVVLQANSSSGKRVELAQVHGTGWRMYSTAQSGQYTLDAWVAAENFDIGKSQLKLEADQPNWICPGPVAQSVNNCSTLSSAAQGFPVELLGQSDGGYTIRLTVFVDSTLLKPAG